MTLEAVRRLRNLVDGGVAMRGAQVVIRLGNDAIVDDAFGYANPGTPITVDTLFPVHCAVKPVVAATLVLMQEAGVLKLEDTLESISSIFAASSLARATIVQVLTHTASFPPVEPPLIVFPDAAAKQVVVGSERHSVTHQAYSPYLGFAALDYAVEDRTGESLQTWSRRLVLQPLELDLHLAMSDAEYCAASGRLGTGYRPSRAGGLVADLSDLTLRSCAYRNIGGTGRASARALSRFFEIMQAATLEPSSWASVMVQTRSGRNFDGGLRRTCEHGLGMFVHLADHEFFTSPPDDTYGCSAAQGAIFVVVDAPAKLQVSVVTNGFEQWTLTCAWRRAFLQDIYSELGLL